MALYHIEIQIVVDLLEEGRYTKAQARKELRTIEDNWYKKLPNAEPDGDITYAVASAMDEINEYLNKK